MRALCATFLGVCLAMGPALGAEESRLTFYVQLVRGTDDAKPPTPESKRIGPKLGAQLRSVLAWKHYWEISQREVRVAPGAKAKVKLNQEREVEIDLGAPGKRKVTAYCQNKPISSVTDPRGLVMSIIGGDRDARSSWFVVVRRDKPSVE